MSEQQAPGHMWRPEDLMGAMVKDPQATRAELSEEAQRFCSDELGVGYQAYQVCGDPDTLTSEMRWGPRQDLYCLIALTDATRIVGDIAGADPEEEAGADRIGDWIAVIADVDMSNLTMTRTALRSEPVHEDTADDDVASMSTLIDFVAATAGTEVRPDEEPAQCRELIAGANAVPLSGIEAIRGGLIANLARDCPVVEDPQENLQFWIDFVSEGTDAVAEQRLQNRRIAAQRTRRVMAQSALAQAG